LCSFRGWKSTPDALTLSIQGRNGFSAADETKQMTAKVEIYTGANCAYCVAAKNLLKSKGLDYQEFRIDQDPLKRDEMLTRAAQRRTVPQIFINDEHIGGFDELVAADRSGKLVQIIGSQA
jgi:glutaredoxin 3